VADTRLLCRKGTWYYRRAVPKHLVSTLGRAIVQKSLLTKDKSVAKQRREIEDVKWSARFAAAEAGTLPEPGPGNGIAMADHELMALVRDYVAKATLAFQEREIAAPSNGSEREEVVIETEIGLSILRNPDDIRADQWIAAIEGKLLQQAGISPETITAETDLRLYDFTRRALLELQRRKLARYEDRFDRAYFDALFDPDRPDPLSFKTLAEQYLAMQIEEADANGMSSKWADKVRSRVVLVRELIGDETLVASIDYDSCLKARSLLARTPSNRTKLYPGLSLAASIAKAQEDGKPLLAPVTQAGYLDTLRDMLELATLKRLLPNNPASTLRPLKRDDVRPEDKRDSFTLEQLKTFFTGEFYQSCAPNAPKPYSKPDREWRFWLPLLSLYMGMRPNEICQMLPSDVKCTAKATWYVDIIASTDDEEDGEGPYKSAKTLKTATSRRKIPVHPELIALGFIAFVEGRKAAKADRLFEGLKPDKYGNRASYALKRFRDSFLKEAITVEPKQTFYSFRHCFRDALRRSKAGPDILKAFGGWSQGNLTSDNYGDKANPDLHVKAMAKVSYPGLDIGFLYPAALG